MRNRLVPQFENPTCLVGPEKSWNCALPAAPLSVLFLPMESFSCADGPSFPSTPRPSMERLRPDAQTRCSSLPWGRLLDIHQPALICVVEMIRTAENCSVRVKPCWLLFSVRENTWLAIHAPYSASASPRARIAIILTEKRWFCPTALRQRAAQEPGRSATPCWIFTCVSTKSACSPLPIAQSS